MTEEEAIQHCKIQANIKDETDFAVNNYILGTAIETVLNLIQKQQEKLEKKDKIINEMTQQINKAYFCESNFYKPIEKEKEGIISI